MSESKAREALKKELFYEQKNGYDRIDVKELLALEKSLVYFSTSLKANEATIEKIFRGRVIKLYDEDQDLLEDVLIEMKQAIEMASIYSGILSSMMDGFSSIISNNQSIVMWRLTIVTIILEIPNIMFAFYGINTEDIPFNHTWVALSLTALLTGITAFVLLKWKKK